MEPVVSPSKHDPHRAVSKPIALPTDVRQQTPDSTSPVAPRAAHGMRSGHLNLDTFSPVNQNGSFAFDRVLKSGQVNKRTRKTKVPFPLSLFCFHPLQGPADSTGNPAMEILLCHSAPKSPFDLQGQHRISSPQTNLALRPNNCCLPERP